MDLANDLQEELTCSVCMDYFIDPVTISCGHSFCHLCLLKCWEDTQTSFSCPECRGACDLKDFQINLRLKKLAIIGKQLRPRLLKNSTGEGLCGRHQQALKLFCQQDGSLICVSCFNSEAHRDHSVYPIEDSADFYRGTFQELLNHLWKEMEQVQALLSKERKKIRTWKEEIQIWRQNIVIEFEKMHQFLDEEEEKCGCERNIVQEFSHAAAMARSLLFGAECVLYPWDKGNAQQTCRNEFLEGPKKKTIRELSLFPNNMDLPMDSVNSETPDVRFSSQPLEYLDVTLDPSTASPYVIVSQDRRSVRIAETPPDVPNHQDRFDNCTSVLGSQAFTSGRHYWEVEVGDKAEWEVAVSYEFRGQKHRMRFLQEKTFSLFSTHSGNGDGPCITFPGNRVPVRRVGVFLDYEAGILSFYNATESYLIYSFLPTRFSGPVRPIFSPCLMYGQHDQEPITICPVNDIIL
ncbi:probable E3 ubiquitin-protein ligase TRIML1 [Tachyglossus aculeatus]|uniref:probable E3 ubiquitin-protein ligase TRIML1 n=1 Tax=Tachyglossus aculeatus TaxID=9261 RepID=UPI0018F33C8A|nr:probable E3 ubiquitin-protein ligase TRIML1 [Tachyglossus aculeatus]